MRRVVMKRRLISLLYLLVILSLILPLIIVAQDSIRLELLHRHAPQLNGRPKTQHERLKDLLLHDFNRHKWRQGLKPTPQSQRQAWEWETSNANAAAAVEMPLGSGRDFGIGQYVTSFKVGTPSQKFRVIVDTGSDLTWINCRFRCGRGRGRGDNGCSKPGRIKRRRVFHAHLSSSFTPVPCFSDMCRVELINLFSLTTCPTPLAPCAYDYRYVDGSAAKGVFANETVTVGLTSGRMTRLHNVLIGCSDSFQGPTLNNVDGVMGLANSKYSFATKAAKNFGGKFSYCLVDHLSHVNASSYLIFGTNDSQLTALAIGNTRHTRLELNADTSFYAVNVMGISIDGKMLDIPFQVWDTRQGGGTILDSGTSLTFLTDPAYQPVMAAMKTSSVSKYKKVKLDGVPMEYCFNSTGFDETSVPKLVIHFADGARFEPHWRSYVIAAADGVRCLGFLPARFPGTSVIGNIMQQNYMWEFDLERRKLGFTPSPCTSSS